MQNNKLIQEVSIKLNTISLFNAVFRLIYYVVLVNLYIFWGQCITGFSIRFDTCQKLGKTSFKNIARIPCIIIKFEKLQLKYYQTFFFQLKQNV